MHILVETAFKNLRSALNSKFELARSQNSKLDSKEFLSRISLFVTPCLELLVDKYQERIGYCCEQAYEACLDLSVNNIFEKTPLIVKVWTDLIPEALNLFSKDPERFLRVSTNALFNISQHRTANASLWLTLTSKYAKDCETIEEFEKLGKLAAWVCGMAQYRDAALDIAVDLPDPVVAGALDIEIKSTKDKRTILENTRENPWIDPKNALLKKTNKTSLKLFHKCAGFRGLNGPFLNPPSLILLENNLIAFDNQSAWSINADFFGVHLQRLSIEQNQLSSPKSSVSEIPISIKNASKLTFNQFQKSQHIYATTSKFSHHVFLFGEIWA